MNPLLKITNMTKTFGKLSIFQDIGLEVYPGEVVGLAGSNGSGKSVLIMILAGFNEPDQGKMYFDGKYLAWPFLAQDLGIGVIHQKPTLVNHFDVMSNIFLGNERGNPDFLGRFKVLDQDRMFHEATELVSRLDIKVSSLGEKVSNLSGGQRQMVAIAHMLTYPLKLVILDEPTLALTYEYQQRLLELILQWKREGVSVLFSTNNIDHLMAVTDRILVLNAGQSMADFQTDETDREEIVNLLIGRDSVQSPEITLWDIESYDQIRENSEKLRYHQMLLEKDLAAEGTLNRQLTRQLAEQVHTLDVVNQALIEAQKRLIDDRELERKHLARELHDQIIQDLLSLNYEIEEIETHEDISPALSENLVAVRKGIRELVNNLRRICGNLRPATIDSLGIGSALQSFASEWSNRTDIKVIINLDKNLSRLPEPIELSIYRIIQEGLNNVWRHSKATQVIIELRHTSTRSILVSVEDNGVGVSEELDIPDLVNKGHFGLLGIGERVTLLGGKMRLKRQPVGSLLQVELPHPKVQFESKTEEENHR
ncbi:MAG: ATP-binding cassette domain-containing protein [Chloroflexi bacterium]|nr:ATP-binding cassette domain-containing protein [Chloroflexota bacterium]